MVFVGVRGDAFGTKGQANDRIDLNARTDNAARKEAKRVANQNKDISDYRLMFFRASDSCTGWIDA